jgi:uncharacterized protein YciI
MTGTREFPTLSPAVAKRAFSFLRNVAVLPCWLALCVWSAAAIAAQDSAPADDPASEASVPESYDAELAARLGADERGMRQYVLVILKTGPTRVTDPEARKAMFEGHFANMTRLAEAGKLVLAGPLDGVDGWRGLFVYAVADIKEAQQLTATDPVITEGEMVAEYHQWYGSAGVMMINEIHAKVARAAP